MSELFLAIGIARHRMGSDGVGVTTLVGGYGCPLACRYCLNPQCTRITTKPIDFTIESLYEAVRADSLYFDATGGGITFGGGEPLLQAEFIADFIRFCREKGEGWTFAAETCLAVPEETLRAVLPYIDEWIVDVKDMDDEIYRAYTGRDSGAMKANLAILAETCPDKVRVKTPLIPDFNTPEHLLRSQIALTDMGFAKIERLRYTTEIKK